MKFVGVLRNMKFVGERAPYILKEPVRGRRANKQGLHKAC